jgi:hypothetical protein
MFKKKVTAEFETTISALTNDLTAGGEFTEAKIVKRLS